jgi:hypothetical protein
VGEVDNEGERGKAQEKCRKDETHKNFVGKRGQAREIYQPVARENIYV